MLPNDVGCACVCVCVWQKKQDRSLGDESLCVVRAQIPYHQDTTGNWTQATDKIRVGLNGLRLHACPDGTVKVRFYSALPTMEDRQSEGWRDQKRKSRCRWKIPVLYFLASCGFEGNRKHGWKSIVSHSCTLLCKILQSSSQRKKTFSIEELNVFRSRFPRVTYGYFKAKHFNSCSLFIY